MDWRDATSNDLVSLIRCCCENNCEENFSRFRFMSSDYLVAALSRFSNDWQLVAVVSDKSYQAYRQFFEKPFDPMLDYRNCFYAVGYCHLLLHRGDSGRAEALVTRIMRHNDVFALQYEETLAVFFAILHLEYRCRFYYLAACLLPLAQDMGVRLPDCDESLRKLVMRIFG